MERKQSGTGNGKLTVTAGTNHASEEVDLPALCPVQQKWLPLRAGRFMDDQEAAPVAALQGLFETIS